jgi:ketosteroid isomerase-like protein
VPPSRQRNLALLRRLYEGLESGSTDTILSVLGPSVVIRVTGAGDLDGVFRGRPEAKAFYARVLHTLGHGFKVPPYDILVHDASLVVVPRGSTFGDAGMGLDIYHFEDGLISEVWLTTWKTGETDST